MKKVFTINNEFKFKELNDLLSDKFIIEGVIEDSDGKTTLVILSDEKDDEDENIGYYVINKNLKISDIQCEKIENIINNDSFIEYDISLDPLVVFKYIKNSNSIGESITDEIDSNLNEIFGDLVNEDSEDFIVDENSTIDSKSTPNEILLLDNPISKHSPSMSKKNLGVKPIGRVVLKKPSC